MRIKLSDHFSFSKLIKFTLSPILMMIFTSIYNVVDGFFISNYAGKIPFAAVNLIMPFLMILGTVGFMLGSGGSAICAKTYGEGDKQGCNSYFSFFVYVAIAIGIVLSVLGNIFLRWEILAPGGILRGPPVQPLSQCRNATFETERCSAQC